MTTNIVDVNDIKSIYNEQKYAEYVGGTLSYEDSNGSLVLANISDNNLPKETLLWLAKCYLKWKTPRHCFYERASNIVKGNWGAL